MSKIWVNFFLALTDLEKCVSMFFISNFYPRIRLIEMEKEIYGRATLAQQGMPSHSTSVQERIYFWSVLQPTFLQLFPFLRTYVYIYEHYYCGLLETWGRGTNLSVHDMLLSMEHATCMFTVSFQSLSFLYYMTYIKGRGVIEVNVVSGICIEALSDAVTCQ